MSLDDSINQARHAADRRAQTELDRVLQERRELDQAQELCEQAAARLAGLGRESFTLVRPAKWYEFTAIHHDTAGGRYREVSSQRCWIIAEMSGLRWSGRGTAEKGPFLHYPVMLLADGTIGRFWPRPDIASASRAAGHYTSVDSLDSLRDDRSLFVGHGETYLVALKRRLAEAVVRYERQAR